MSTTRFITIVEVSRQTPAVWMAYRTRRPTGISPGTWLLILGELFCFAVYGLYMSDPRLTVLGCTGVTASILILARTAWTRRAVDHIQPQEQGC